MASEKVMWTLTQDTEIAVRTKDTRCRSCEWCAHYLVWSLL